MKELFLKALRNKYRFDTDKGKLNMEQLFSLGKTDLDKLYRSLQATQPVGEGLMGKRDSNNTADKMEIVKMVFEDLVARQTAAEDRENKAELKKVLMEAAAKKEVDELIGNKSAADLRKAALEL